MSHPDLLRQTLHTQAESALEGIDAAALVRTGLAAHRRRRHRGVAVCAVLTIALAAAAAIPLTRLARSHPTPAASPPYPTYASPMQWPTRGSLAGDKVAIQALTASYIKVKRVLYIGDGPDPARKYGILLSTSVNDHDLEVVLCTVRDGATQPRRWTCQGPMAPGEGVVSPSAVLLLTGDSARSTQLALAAPGGHITGMSELYATEVDDNGQPSPPANRPTAPVTETADGLVIKAGVGPANVASFAMQVVVKPQTGPPVRVTATQSLSLMDNTGMHAEVYWGWGPDKRLRGLPPLLDNPEQNPGLQVWARLHGLTTSMPGYYSPIWGGTLADGSRAILIQPLTPVRISTAFMVNPPAKGTDDTFLVRDVDNPPDPDTVHQISAYLPLSNGRCELVVVAAPGTTRITYRPTSTSSFTDLSQPQNDGVGRLVVPTCDGHQDAAIQVFAGANRTYEGPIDSTRPNAGPRH